ncbi:MAG: hypothetical protein V1774_00270 [Candidatus Eisenbacteria bacterium]
MAVAKKRTRKTLTATQRITRERAIIHDLKGGDLSYRQIAAKHKVSLPTVNAKARKAGIRRRGVALSKTRIARTTMTAPQRRRTIHKGRRLMQPRQAQRTTVGVGRTAGFNEQFRSLVMQYYPSMPLARFERLRMMVRRAMS